jgi:23S rRNA G2069 N7-methylase RlmK/C1962 C5-methylase RlmI
MVLNKIGKSINSLSDLWQAEIPPLPILIVRNHDDLPGTVIDGYLDRYVARCLNTKLTQHNRAAMVERVTDIVFDYKRWDEVGSYFGIE